jgi:hypothetical protein
MPEIFRKGTTVNWFFRIIGFLVLTVLELLVFLSRVTLQVLLLPLLVAVLWLIRSLLFFSITATVSGPRQFIDRRAGEWTERIYEGSATRDHLGEVFQLCRILVGAIIVLGWVVAGLFTYSLIRVYFGLFT